MQAVDREKLLSVCRIALPLKVGSAVVTEITGAKILVAAADLLVTNLMTTKSEKSLQTSDQRTMESLVCGPDASSDTLVNLHGREMLATFVSFPVPPSSSGLCRNRVSAAVRVTSMPKEKSISLNVLHWPQYSDSQYVYPYVA